MALVVTEDRTEFQADRAKASKDAPKSKWKWQRAMAAISFGAACLYPLIYLFVAGETADRMNDLAVHWYIFHGGVVATWFTGSTIAASWR